MTTLESRRRPVSRKSMIGQTLFVIVLLLIMRFLWVRNQPERLTPSTIPGMISGENRYALVYGDSFTPSDPSIQVQSLHGVTARTLAREDNRSRFYQRLLEGSFHADSFSISDGKLYYAMEPQPPKIRIAASGTRPTAVSGRDQGSVVKNIGTFRLEPKSSADTEVAGKKRAPKAFITPKVRIRQLVLQGGNPQDVMTVQGEQFCFIGDHVFWIRPSPDDIYKYTLGQGLQKGTAWYEEICHSDLMLTSLKDGKTQRVYSGICHYTYLAAGPFGVSWEEPAPFPGKPKIFYARVSDGSVHALAGLKENGFDFDVRSSIEFENRLYWLAASSTPQTDRRRNLISANLDGADIREIFTQRDKHPIDGLLLHVYRGSLYGCFTEASTTVRGDVDVASTTARGNFSRHDYLCRIRPERSDPVEIVVKLPDNSIVHTFDAGYLYFYRPEPKGSLWATLTSDGANMDMTPSLCRVPLDH